MDLESNEGINQYLALGGLALVVILLGILIFAMSQALQQPTPTDTSTTTTTPTPPTTRQPTAVMCSPGEFGTCGTNGCGSNQTSECNSSGNGWLCYDDTAACSPGSVTDFNDVSVSDTTPPPSSSSTQPPTNPLPDTALFFEGELYVFVGLILIVSGSLAVRVRSRAMRNEFAE